MLAVLVGGPADAVVKCVALGSATTCTAPAAQNKADWTATCTTGGAAVSVQGIGFCSNQAGSAQFVKSTTLTTDGSKAENNLNCWCKMVSPAVSSWVFLETRTSASACVYGCAHNCGYHAQYTTAFRNALFSGLGD